MASVQPEAGVAIVGVDPSSKKLAMMILDEDDPRGVVCDAPNFKERSLVLGMLRLKNQRVFLDLYEQYEKWWLWAERPLVGPDPNATIVQAQVQGVVLADAVQYAASGAYQVHPSTWKKDVVGNGAASKAEIREWLAVHHPLLADVAGADQDLVDAACIALYGQRILERSAKLTGADSVLLDS